MDIVAKFGGKIFKSNSDIVKVAKYIKREMKQGDRMVVVVGAMGGLTYKLMNEAISIDESPSNREMDVLLATAEQSMAAKLAIALEREGISAISLSGGQAGLRTTENHRNAKLKSIDVSRIKNEVDNGRVVVVAGFQGIAKNGDVTTFCENYGGSDLSAVIIAAALGWDCILYKDVSGIYTVDPEFYPSARKLDSLDYNEVAQMASTVSGVVEAYAVELAYKFKINIYISDMNNDYKSGTVITKKIYSEGDMPISNIAFNNNVTLFSVSSPNFETMDVIGEIYNDFATAGISTTAAVKEELKEGWCISFCCRDDDAYVFKKRIPDYANKDGVTVDCKENLSAISVSGQGMAEASGIIARILNLFYTNTIEYYCITTSEISITLIINCFDVMRTIVAISKEFDL